MPKIRVLVVDDSLTVRQRLIEALAADAAFEVVAEGETGKDAIELCRTLRPDVISLDMMMPLMSGLSATEYIMAYTPTPILIVSASVNRGEGLRTMDALAAGALDVLDKPNEDCDGDAWDQRYRAALRTASRLRVITHPRAKLAAPRSEGDASVLNGEAPRIGQTSYELVAIGASTGGPAALASILPALPSDFPLPILLVMHMDARFDESLRDWLDHLSPLPVRHARHGQALPRRGERGVLLAPAGHHLQLRGNRLLLDDGPERHACRPSIDVLFSSLAGGAATQTIACLLTGMGSDGATGLLDLRRAGAMTLAQDEQTSAVYGMPAEAARLGAAQRILPLPQFAPLLRALARDTQPPRPVPTNAAGSSP